jgi:CRISPR-associated protein Cas2
MMVLVTYDVSTIAPDGKRRLRLVAKKCKNYGQRVQNSVFECLIDPAQYAKLKFELEKIIDIQFDSLRFYLLGKNWGKRVEHIGAKTSYNPEGILIQ